MTLLHYGIRGGMDAFSYFAGLFVIIVGFIFFILLAIATNGFKHPGNEKKNDDLGQRR